MCDTNRIKLWAGAQSGVCDSTGIKLWAGAQSGVCDSTGALGLKVECVIQLG